MESSREKKERSTKRDLAQVSGEGDERARMDMGLGSEIVERQATLAFFGDGLKRLTRRGLKKVLLLILEIIGNYVCNW